MKRTPGNICVQAGRESRGIVWPFSPASVCNLFVCPNVRRRIYMHTPRQSVKETYRVRSTYLYRDIIPNITPSIVNDFPSVFVEKLGKSRMNVPEMKIHLTDPYVPYCVSTARQVPLRFQTMAEQIVADLVKAEVIEPESDPTEWCAPAFFVPKGDGLRVRLVTDYTKLNRHVRRPVHPFPSVKEIVRPDQIINKNKVTFFVFS